MLEININDIIGVLNSCKQYLIAMAVVLLLAIGICVGCRKRSAKTKYLFRSQSVICGFLALILIANLIAVGPMSTLISLAAGNGTVTQETADEASGIAEDIAGEGMVLLKNDDMLPLKDQRNINLFGWSSINPVYGGAGSGSINDLWPIVSLEEGLENAGFQLNTELHDFYENYTSSRPKMSESKQAWTLPEPTADMYTEDLMNNAKDFSDVAVVVISRIGGEGYNDMPKDLSQVAYDSNSDKYDDFPEGHHYLELSQTEKDMVDTVCNNFDNVLLLYNSAHSFELGFVEEHPEIKSVIWCPGTGNVGFNALGKILTGEVNPSGRTSDTFVYDLTNTPWWNNSDQLVYTNMEDMAVTSYRRDGTEMVTKPKFTNYVEGIYVGYKWYETAAAEKFIDYEKTVQYPFGYGLSYTDFTQTMSEIQENGNEISFDVTVTNVGDTAGKDVVEVYVNPPYTNGGIEKSAAKLLTFEKTDLLESGESQEIHISFSKDDLASYDDQNANAYVLEEGDYQISINKDSHNILDSKIYTVEKAQVYDKEARESDNIPAVNQFDFANGGVTYLSRKDGFANYDAATAAPASVELPEEYIDTYYNNDNFDYSMYIDDSVEMPVTGANNGIKLADMRGLAYDDPKWEDFLDQLTVDEMSDLSGMAGFQTAAVKSVDKVATVDCDGPASINNNFTGTGSIGFPVAVMIASTWNKDLAYKFGESIGKMANEMNVNGWYAPAMNTHRTPFGGRNFEYYSEDGVLAGNIAANAVAGAKSRGVYSYIKHFAMYDSNAMMVSIWSNEQAMREIYLKPFEYAVKDGGANAVMEAWCYIGNRWAGSCSELLKTVLRDEWGFEGFVLTDNFANSGWGYMNADIAFNNGVDALLTTYDSGLNRMSDLTAASNVAVLRNASKNIMYTVVNSSAYESENINAGMENWKYGLILANVVVLAILCLIEWFVVRKHYKKLNSVEA
ncbi:glycoside hydrolase family 3 N-terminal domain-containing protein [Blautia sp. HCP3S3_H10_1]|uniref:glycoside hydrolase family 3 N-terminal domain-containing protein n=1 Tax=unclassified Blautia TaxID=2648079 RepID=UPI003F8F34C1|nr:glycoside hydrolase family 3 N-terminal domain-containing protein [Clostridia bacterium]